MKLALPILTVIDRAVPYALSHVEIPIFEEDALLDTARCDLLQMQTFAAGPHADQARRRLDRIIRVDVGSRFIAAPGDPGPFVRRDVGAVDCGALPGIAAVYCAVMARR